MTGSIRDRIVGIRAPSTRGLALVLVVWAYCSITFDLLTDRLSASRSLWQTDFAIFRQAGYVVSRGELGQVYRFIPSTAVDVASYPAVWETYLSNVQGYYYAQAPWHTLAMVPFGLLDYRTGFVVFTVVMILSLLAAALLVGNYTEHSVGWVTAILASPLLVPFFTTNPWNPEGFSWHWVGLGGPVRFETILGVTLWYGQYTPLLLALLTAGFVAASRGRPRIAGLLLVLATMKPNVLFGIPLVLLVTDRWGRLVRWTAFWALALNIVFSLVPFFGYPGDFVHLVFSYTDVFWPIVLQAHNYVWMIGIVLVTVALRYDAADTPAAIDVFEERAD